jgi:ribulose-phosphate 3-epimerase
MSQADQQISLPKEQCMPKIFPSLISGDLLNLATQIKRLESYCDGFHLDVMDQHFVPNLTWGPAFINAIRKATDKKLWIHLMVDTPRTYLPLMHLSPGDCVSIHYEGQPFATLIHLIELVKEHGQEASIAIKPETSIAALAPIVQKSEPDQVLLMSVKPGFSGQKFLPNSLPRLDELVTLRASMNKPFTIGMDGGINEDNIKKLIGHGVDEVAIASGIFSTADPAATLQRLGKI